MDKHRIFHLLVVDKKTDYRGMISVQDLPKVIATDEKARADLLEAFMFLYGRVCWLAVRPCPCRQTITS
jgi:hypothetical protein